MQSRAELHDLAERFCAIYRTNPALQRAHEQMVEDGMPASLILTPEQRKAGWARSCGGKRLQPTRSMTFGGKKPAKEITDAGTARLLAEMRAKERADEAAKAKRNAESREIGRKKRTRTLALKAEVAKANAAKPVAIPAPAPTTVTPEPAKPATPETPKETTMKTAAAKKTPARRAQPATGKGSARKAAKTAKTGKAAPAARANARKAVETDGPRKGSKLETIAKLIKRSGGCTAADVLKACDWKAVNMPRVAKAAGIAKLSTEKKDGVTVYSAAT